MGEEKGGGAVVELDQEHVTIQIVDFAQDLRLLPKSHAAVVISN